MAKHRAEPRRRVDAAPSGRLHRAVLPAALSSVIIASVATAGGVAVVHPEGVASTMYDVAALIIEGSSTNPTGAGIADFYGGKFATGSREVVQVNFFTGPFGVYDALKNPTDEDDEDNVVMSSGWGAANVSLLLSYLEATGDPVAANAVYVLDNNVARPNGGFGTRYPVFALIGVNPLPTPTSPGAKVIDVGYEYDINGNTPAYVLNPFAMANSLAAYFGNRLDQEAVDLPVDANGNLDLSEATCEGLCPEKLEEGQPITAVIDGETVVIEQVGDTTYISYRSDGLPLLQPLRTYGGEAGNKVADAIEDPLTDVVNYGYPGNDPLADPDVYQPAALLPTPDETETFLRNLADPDNNARPPAGEAEADGTGVESAVPQNRVASLPTGLVSPSADDKTANSPKFLRKVGRNVTGATSDSSAEARPRQRIDDVAKKATDRGSQRAENKDGDPPTNKSTD